jgi:hypothetical protein
MIDGLANAYRYRVVGDHAENVETVIKHGMTALRGMDEIPAFKLNTIYSTCRFRSIQPCFWLLTR